MPEELKRCTKCGEFKEKSEFSKDKTRKDGLYSWCKKCSSEQNKKYYGDTDAQEKRKKNREERKKRRKWLEGHPTQKYCIKCGEFKEKSEFKKDKTRKDGLSYWCKKCVSEDDKKYREEYRSKNPYKAFAKRTITNHKSKGHIDPNLSKDELAKLEDYTAELAENTPNCPYCGVELLYLNKGESKPESATADRIDNEKGLTIKNMKICCHKCNSMKNSNTPETLLKFAIEICEFKNLDPHEVLENVIQTYYGDTNA